MTTQHKPGMTANLPSEAEVVDYLKQHDDFFEQHEELLKTLSLNHDAGSAVSLIERQVLALREENRDLTRKLSNLIGIARENDKLNARMQNLTLALLEAQSQDDIFYIIQDRLRSEFDADSVSIRLFSNLRAPIDADNVFFIDRNDARLNLFQRFFDKGKPICGPLEARQGEFLFGDASEHIASASLIPICNGDCFGLLAIGSQDLKRFHHGMGTLFLSYLGELVGSALQQHLE